MPNNLSHLIRRFNRFELKYLLTLQQAELFKKALLAYLSPDQHGDQQGSYWLDSLYFDSPDHRFYWEKVDGVKFRRKLRIRHYAGEAPLVADTPVFVEIKQRVDRVTQKRRVRLPYETALNLCTSRELPDYEPEDQPVMEEIYALLWQYNLRQASIVRYSRQALVGSDYDLGLRVTFDTALTYEAGQLDLAQISSPLPLFPAEIVVMEIKANERIPYWLTELVAAHNLRLARVSKYCRSIECSQHLPTVDMRRVSAGLSLTF